MFVALNGRNTIALSIHWKRSNRASNIFVDFVGLDQLQMANEEHELAIEKNVISMHQAILKNMLSIASTLLILVLARILP